MYVFSHLARAAGRRIIVGTLLAIVLVFNSVGTLYAAGTTGTISGTVTDSKTGLPISGVTVSAVAPTARFDGKTDAQGFFSFTGALPDTYTVSFQLSGFEPTSESGVNVFPDETARVDQKLVKSLTEIGHVTARSPGGAYQPTQTNDQYTVTNAQIETIQGKNFNTGEVNLLTSLPGASLDSSGYPVLRGGRENEEGYQFEGISIVDSYSNQFQNSLSVNGINNFQLTPGAGNATNGNAGTGTINYTAKRGTYPSFGSTEADVNSAPFGHQFAFEYGFASPDGRISNYFSFIGQRNGVQYGARGIRAVDNGEFYNSDFTTEDNYVDNFIYKFGANKDTELQLLYQSQVDYFDQNYGGSLGLPDTFSDPYYQSGNSLQSLPSFLGFTNSEITNVNQSLPGHPNGQPYGKDAIYQPEAVMKLQLSHNFGSSAFLRAAYYGVDAVTLFDLPDPGTGVYEPQGSLKHGVSLDFTKQLNNKNLVQIGAKYEYNHPIFAVEDSAASTEAVALGADTFGIGPGRGFEFADFIPSGSPSTLFAGSTCADIFTFVLGVSGGDCGYIASRLPGAKLPLYDRTSQIDRGDYAAYINDQLSISDRIKAEAGLRLDGNVSHFPGFVDGMKFTIPNAASHPLIVEPRLAVSIQVTKNDAVRASFARSTQFPPLGVVARTINRSAFNQFNSIPSWDNITMAPATFCGVTKNQACANYAEQLYSEYQDVAGIPLQPVKPETFTSYDFSYSHQFPYGIAVKVTPFYTRGYDIVDRVSNVIAVNPTTNKPIFGPALATNDGVERTTGVEFLLTREAAYGFTGQLSATYLNKLSNVPPLSSSEDFFPTIPTASLALGDLYRVGYLSPFQATLAFQYKSRGGLRINPQITYNRGYPYNNGTITATYVNGVPVNIPLTDVTGPSVGSNPSQFVDPANPGTVFNPNIAAKLNTPESRNTGGLLSTARFNTNVTLEFSPPRSHSTFGVQIFNVFNQLYGLPGLNTALQPVANGVLGPQTGKLANFAYPFSVAPYSLPYLAATPADEGGLLPYTILNVNTPTSFLLYYNLKL